MNNNSSRNGFLKVILSFLVIIITLVSIAFLTGNSFLSKISRGTLDISNLGIRDDISNRLDVDEISDIVNIAILGVDESSDDAGRSDAIMIGTLDPIHKKLKVTSLMRDTYVNIPGYGNDKLNHAYAYGGPELTIKTLNQNFGLNITDYVKVNFDELVEIVDALNGIDIELSQEELDGLTEHLNSAYALAGSNPETIKVNSDGTYHLDGFQALGYCRIRNTSHSDFDRTTRQRKVINEMFSKISAAGPKELLSMSKELLPYVETSLSNAEILNLSYNVLSIGTTKIEQERFPRNEYCNDAEINGTYYLWYDANYTEEQMFEYIFNDNKVFLKDNQPVYVPQHEKSTEATTPASTNNNKDTDPKTKVDTKVIYENKLKDVPVINTP